MEKSYARQVGINQFIPTLITSFPELRLESSKFFYSTAGTFLYLSFLF